jgi:hypothetical protein
VVNCVGYRRVHRVLVLEQIVLSHPVGNLQAVMKSVAVHICITSLLCVNYECFITVYQMTKQPLERFL